MQTRITLRAIKIRWQNYNSQIKRMMIHTHTVDRIYAIQLIPRTRVGSIMHDL